MPTSSQDTEITLGTGRMLALFFTFVLVCAVFFAIGFSLGRKTSTANAGAALGGAPTTPAAVVRPSAAKDATAQTAAQPAAQPTDFSFYKSVSAKTADAELKPADLQKPASSSEQAKLDPPKTDQAKSDQTKTDQTTPDQAKTQLATASTTAPAPVAGGGYFVQVAAVTRQEDAQALVDALKKKQYPAFAANTGADRFFHVQVGPYAELKDAEGMKARLVADGYNPIVKK